jgi:hypothetical protein
MWIIASIPFWIAGAFFAYATPAVVIAREPNETNAEIFGQSFSCLLLCGVFLSIAAKIAS